jgi:hypothetical protein
MGEIERKILKLSFRSGTKRRIFAYFPRFEGPGTAARP